MEPHRFQKGQVMLLAGLRRHHETATAAASVDKQWRDFLSEIPVAARVGTHYYGAMCGMDKVPFPIRGQRVADSTR